jgi:tetratricopeptide (TPR) repeat protein
VAGRISAEPAAAAELAARYLGLPRVAIEMGRWLAANPQFSLADVLQDLRAGAQNSELDYIVRRQLDGTSGSARRLLALLAQAPVAELTQAAVAAMADAGQERTADLLAELSSRSLVEWRRPSRCRITPQARQLAEPPPAKAAAAAQVRLARHFAVLAAAHAEALTPGQSQEAAMQAAQWFRAEDVALLHLLTAPDPPARAAPHLWQVAAALDTWFAREHRMEDRQAAAEAMAEAAASLGDGTAAAVAQLRLAALARERGDLAAAAQGLERVHSLLPGGDPWRIQLHTEYTVYFLTTGDSHAARDHLLAARQARSRRDPAGRITDLINQAALEIRCEELDAAHVSLVQALDLAEDSADTAGQAHAHELLGLVAYRNGHPHLASRAWAQARTLYEQAGDDLGQARCLQHEGSARLAQPGGDRAGAVDMLNRSLILRADQPPGIGAGLTHLYLAEQAARMAETEEVAWHCRAGLTALQAWVREAAEPPEVTAARTRLADLQRGVLSR